MNQENTYGIDPIDEIDINELLGITSPPNFRSTSASVKSAEASPSPTPVVNTPAPAPQPQANVSTATIAYSNKQRELTDLGNAERLVDMFGHELRYSHAKERWYYWDGRRWAWARSGELTRCAAKVARSIAVEAGLACNSHQSGRVLNHARSSQNQLRLKAMIELARDLLPIPVAVDALDADPWKFNCLNGTIDLKTGTLLPHNPVDLITKIALVAYDPKAKYTGWLRFLRCITGNDKKLIRYLRRMVGYCLTGVCVEHALFIFWGKGANGKSTFFVVVQNMMGDYAMQAPPDLLAARRHGPGHPCDVADLHGSRLAVDSEVSQNMRMDEAKAKRLTGADRIKARHLFKDFFEFEPTFKLAAAVNDKPKVPGDDDAIWRRMHFVPFVVQIPVDQQDKNLAEKLKLEAAGILRWAVEGCREWARVGLQPPDCVLEATKEYRSEMDAVGTFIEDACDIGKGLEIRAGDLYRAYEYWAKQSGLDPMSRTMFGKTVKKKGFKQKRGSKGHHVYLGISADVPDDDDGANAKVSPAGPRLPEDPLKYVPDRYDDKDPLSIYMKNTCYAGIHLELKVDDLQEFYNQQTLEGEPRYTERELVEALKTRGWIVEQDELDIYRVKGITFRPSTEELSGNHRVVELVNRWVDKPPLDPDYDFHELIV